MSLIQTIKAAQIKARKDRQVEAAASLTTLIGEAEAVGKNNGNREVTDQEVVAMVKKFVKNIDETLGVLQPDTEGYSRFQKEKELLSSFLPSQLSEIELREAATRIITELSLSGPKAMGVLMKELKARHEGTYDGSLASKLAKELLA